MPSSGDNSRYAVIAALTAAERDSLKVFWAAFDKHREAINNELQEGVRKIPEFAALMASMTPEIQRAQEERSRGLQRAAILEGAWDPYLDDLHAQAVGYAKMGISFGAWFLIIRMFRQSLFTKVFAETESDRARLADALNGVGCFIDITMTVMGEAYLQAKQDVILKQQEAIREISTPVLQVRDRMLVLPIIGMVDTHRARQLTSALLEAIQERRARVVIMDITGVPVVDSKVANHFIQTVEAARLMGALVIVTGVSPQIAQTLVTIGADLGEVQTVADLQGGIEEGEALLGLRVVAAQTARAARAVQYGEAG